MKELKSLIVIPVFNHAGTIYEVTHGALQTGLDVLVVDDGSKDNPLEKIKSLPCQKLRLPVNHGKGAAILAGAREAQRQGKDVIITIDADGQHFPEDIPSLLQKAESMQSPHLIIGSRQMTQISVPQSSHFGKAFSNFWVKLECGYEIEDTQSGFRLYPVNELLGLEYTRTRYDFEIETIVKLAWSGVPILTVPVSVHYPPGKERISHFDKLWDNLRLSYLHTTLVFRRLLPLPYKSFYQKPPVSHRIKEKLQVNPFKTLRKICTEHTSPLWLAIAVWLGIFMGALPLLACHTVAIIYVAHRLHINIVAAVAASQFCMPPVVPVLCIQAGYFLRKGELLFDLSHERWLFEVHERLFEWLIGSLFIGPLLGLLAAAIMYWLAVKIQNAKSRKPA